MVRISKSYTIEKYVNRVVFLFLLIFIFPGLSAQKNVLFLMSDDFNMWLNRIGYNQQAITPNLDKLSAKGVLFSDAQCPSPVCNPARNAIMSGLRPSTTGISSNSGGYFRDKAEFTNVVTMNQYFLDHGYYVYGGGKIYHPSSMNYSKHDVDPDHWTELYTGGNGCSAESALLSYKEPVRVRYKKLDTDIESCKGYQMATAFADKIRNYSHSSNKDKPFFMACGVFRPHLSWDSPVAFWDKWSTDSLNLPIGLNKESWAELGIGPGDSHNNIVDDGKWKEAIHAYLASCAYADSSLGVVLDALNDSPYADNTVVVFCGDHGWNLGEKGHWGKFSYWDQANHTTLIIYDPSAKGNGQVCKKVVSLQDIYPTLIELCDLPERWDVEGNNLKPLLNDPENEEWDEPVLMTHNGNNYIKTNRWRYIEDWDMLFDMEKDPYEWVNLRNEPGMDQVVRELKGKMDSIMAKGQAIRDSLNRAETNHPGLQPIDTDSLLRSETENHSFPGTVEVQVLDYKGQGAGYHDNDNANDREVFRTDESVDIQEAVGLKKDYHSGEIIINPVAVNRELCMDLTYGNVIIELRAYTLKGEIVFTDYIPGEKEVIYPLPDSMHPGVYVVQIKSEGAYITEKIIVQESM